MYITGPLSFFFSRTRRSNRLFSFSCLCLCECVTNNKKMKTQISRKIFSLDECLRWKYISFSFTLLSTSQARKKISKNQKKLFLVAKACLKYFHRHNLTFIYCLYSSSSFTFPRASISIYFNGKDMVVSGIKPWITISNKSALCTQTGFESKRKVKVLWLFNFQEAYKTQFSSCRSVEWKFISRHYKLLILVVYSRHTFFIWPSVIDCSISDVHVG